MELLEFRQTVQTLIAPELGHFRGGNPAVWVDSGDAPGGVTGLLCLIDRQQNMVRHEAYLNHQAGQNFDWVVRLVQRDLTPTGLSAFERAKKKLRQRFPNHRERPLLPEDGMYPQTTFLCNFHALINTYVV